MCLFYFICFIFYIFVFNSIQFSKSGRDKKTAGAQTLGLYGSVSSPQFLVAVDSRLFFSFPPSLLLSLVLVASSPLILHLRLHCVCILS
jgi:hypothetical protein